MIIKIKFKLIYFVLKLEFLCNQLNIYYGRNIKKLIILKKHCLKDKYFIDMLESNQAKFNYGIYFTIDE